MLKCLSNARMRTLLTHQVLTKRKPTGCITVFVVPIFLCVLLAVLRNVDSIHDALLADIDQETVSARAPRPWGGDSFSVAVWPYAGTVLVWPNGGRCLNSFGVLGKESPLEPTMHFAANTTRYPLKCYPNTPYIRTTLPQHSAMQTTLPQRDVNHVATPQSDANHVAMATAQCVHTSEWREV